MPTVLEFRPQGVSSPQASPAQQIPGTGPLQSPVTPDALGVAPINNTAVAQGVVALGQGISQFSQQLSAMNERVNTTAAEEQLVKFTRDKNDLFFNQENGYFNTSGRDAFDGAKPFTQQIEDLQRVHADELASTGARNMFVRASDSQVTGARADVMRHASAQFTAWETATINSRIENSLENSALYWNDPDKLAENLELGRMSVIDLGAISGASPNTIAEDIQTFNSKFAVANIEGALTSSASAAMRALADSKELLEGPDINALQVKIDRQFKVEKNQANSLAAVQVGGSLVQEHGDKANARQIIIDRVNMIDDIEIRDKAMRESMYQLNLHLTATSERRGASFEAAEDFLLSGGSVEQFTAQNPNAWDDLTAGQKSRLMSGKPVSTNFAALSELLLLPPDKLAKVDPAAHFHKLSPGDRQRLISAVKSAREGDGGAQVGRSRTSQITLTMEQFFGRRASWNNKDRESADAIYAALTAEEKFREESKGAPLTSAEFTSMLGDMSREVSINRSRIIPGSTDFSITDVPAEDIGAITAELHRRGKPATADNILQVFREGSP